VRARTGALGTRHCRAIGCLAGKFLAAESRHVAALLPNRGKGVGDDKVAGRGAVAFHHLRTR
jgi:hypothetical protein